MTTITMQPGGSYYNALTFTRGDDGVLRNEIGRAAMAEMLKIMSRVTTLRALPAAEDEQVNVARAAFVQFLLVQAERAHRQLIEFYSDDDPFEVHDERVSR